MTERAAREQQRPWALHTALWAIGGWFFLTVVISYIAGANFMVLKPDHLPRAEDAFGSMIHSQDGTLGLRYLAGEINRHLFTVYGWTQLVLGLIALVSLHLSGVRAPFSKLLVFLCWVSTLVFLLYLVPQIVQVGMKLDLVPKEPLTPDREAFDGLHQMSVGVEVGKLALLALVSVVLLGAGRRTARSAAE